MKWVAIRRFQRTTMPAEMSLNDELDVTIATTMPAEMEPDASLDVTPHTDMSITIPNEATAMPVSPLIDMGAEVAIDSSLTIRTAVDTGFPYTFPIIFGGGVAPETHTEMSAEVDLDDELDVELVIDMGVAITLVDSLDLDQGVTGFTYTFPITLA